MLVPVRLSWPQRMLNELVNPGINIRLRISLNFSLWPTEPYCDRVRCHTINVPHQIQNPHTHSAWPRSNRSFVWKPRKIGKKFVTLNCFWSRFFLVLFW